jgi:2,4-dienoyl-CoA reductase-like NADH-dependent reductase (Old Yellow Enzyme family)
MGRRRSEKTTPMPFNMDYMRRWVRLYGLWTAACKVVHMQQQFGYDQVTALDRDTAIKELEKTVSECKRDFGE